MFDIEQHTADIRIRVVAASAEELFADSVRGLMRVMNPHLAGDSPSAETIELDAPDRTSLLIDLLNEVLLRSQISRRSYEPESIVLGDHAVVARLRSSPVTSFEEDVKAVTYHEAEVQETAGGWTTNLVLDV